MCCIFWAVKDECFVLMTLINCIICVNVCLKCHIHKTFSVPQLKLHDVLSFHVSKF